MLVLEAGPRFDKENLPQTSWETRRYFWAPGLGCAGPQRVEFLRHAAVLSGVGVGGGSVVYGNTLYFPLDSFFDAPVVQTMGGREALAPYFDLAERMMGVVPNATITDTDRLAEEIAKAWDAARPLPRAPWVFSAAMAPRTTNPSRIPTFTERAPPDP